MKLFRFCKFLNALIKLVSASVVLINLIFFLAYVLFNLIIFLVSAYAAFKNNITIVTLYTNLGNDGIVHAINETQVGALLCSFDTWPKVKSVIPDCKSIKKVIVMENQVTKKIILFLWTFHCRITVSRLYPVPRIGVNENRYEKFYRKNSESADTFALWGASWKWRLDYKV